MHSAQESDLWLPFPNEAEVDAFRALYLREFSVKLTPEQAQSVATRFLHIQFVLWCARTSKGDDASSPNRENNQMGRILPKE